MILKGFTLVCSLLMLAIASPAQILPETLQDWIREDTASHGTEDMERLLDQKAVIFKAYNVDRLFTAVYAKGSARMSVLVARTPAPLQAFGLFGIECGRELFQGIIGNAVLSSEGRMRFTYGPFYCEMKHTGSRRRERISAAAVVTVKKALYTWADCDSYDPPIPVAEKVPGSERYLQGPPVWNRIHSPFLEPVKEVVIGRNAFSALFRKTSLRVERTLYSFPVSSEGERKALLREVSNRYARRWVAAENDCDMMAFQSRGDWVYVLEAPDAVLLARTDASDTGCCFWLKDIAARRWFQGR